MANHKLLEVNREQLLQLTDTANARYFAENAVLVYESGQADSLLHARSLASYDSALIEVKVFLSAVLKQDLLVNNLSSAGAVLYLPDGDVEVSVSISGGSPYEPLEQEPVRTPIGIFDAFTWDTVRELEFGKNPLKIFYSHLIDSLKSVRAKLELLGVDWQNVPVDKALLEKCNIQEVASMHTMLHLWGRTCMGILS